MDIFLAVDPITIATQQQGLGFADSFLHRQNFTSNFNIALSARGIFDAIAPPPVKPNSRRTIRRTLLLKKRRTRRRSFSGGESEDGGEDFGFFGGDDGGEDGPFGGGSGGNWSGGGRGWNFDKFGGQSWDESSSWSSAYGFVYEVIYWIALSNCLHFTFEKVSRIMSDSDREKVTMTSVC